MLTALIIVLVLIALLAVPVTLVYRLGWQRGLHGEASLHWLFGLVRVRLPPPRTGKSSPGKGRVKSATAPKAKRKKIDPLTALRLKPFRRRMLRFLRELWRAFRKRDLQLRIRIGLGDPADTGWLWALLGPVSGMLTNVEDANIELEADFVDAVIEVDSRGNVSVIPLQLIYLVLGLLLSPPFWRGMRRMRRAA